MKPAQFLIPKEAFQNKIPLIFDRVFFVPDRFDSTNFTFPGWSHTSLFGNDNPVHVEYCSGNGAWVAEKARQNPLINWVAVEQKIGRGKQVFNKIHREGLKNLIILIGEGEESTKKFFPENSVSAVFVNFPDPWPKRRHAKNRIINPDFMKEMIRILNAGGKITLVTDDIPYSEEMIATVLRFEEFVSIYPEPYYHKNPEGYGNSYFRSLWESKGKEIRLHAFLKKDF